MRNIMQNLTEDGSIAAYACRVYCLTDLPNTIEEHPDNIVKPIFSKL